MEEKVEWTTMWSDILKLHQFVEEKYTDERLKKKLLPMVEQAYEAFKSTLRTAKPKEKQKRVDKAIKILDYASRIEKRSITGRQKKALSDLYSGSSKTPYSDIIAAQKNFPQEPYVWAFAKKLRVYREQME